jgi:hypothetical protein
MKKYYTYIKVDGEQLKTYPIKEKEKTKCVMTIVEESENIDQLYGHKDFVVLIEEKQLCHCCGDFNPGKHILNKYGSPLGYFCNYCLNHEDVIFPLIRK